LVSTLAQRGLLVKDPETNKYGLGITAFELGMKQAWSMKIYQAGVYPIQRLTERIERSSRLSIFDQDEIVLTINNYHPTERFPFGTNFGPRAPAYCTGAGKAVLAWLPSEDLENYLDRTELLAFTSSTITDRDALTKELRKSRERGYAVDREELVNGYNCIAAPIFDHTGNPVGAVSISVDSDILSSSTLKSVSREVISTAMEVSRSMGYLSEPLVSQTEKMADIG